MGPVIAYATAFVSVVALVMALVVASTAQSDGMRDGDAVGGRPAYRTPTPRASEPVRLPRGARVVSPDGDDAAAGSLQRPWRTVGHAIRSAPAGAPIVLRRGTYHESIEVHHERVVLQAYPGEEVWFDGSEVVTGWRREGNAWRHDGWRVEFDNHDYTAGDPRPDWRMVDPRYPMARWPDLAFLDGKQLRQVGKPSQLGPGRFLVDYENDRLWLGEDPRGRKVEAATLAEALWLNHAHGSVVRGIGFRRYATPMRQMGAVKGYADDLLVEDSVFLDSALAGLSVEGHRIRVRRSRFAGNGQLGLHGHNLVDSEITDSVFVGNNTERFAPKPVAGGVKVTNTRRLRITGNLAEDNRGTGFWVDEDCVDTVITRNTVRSNARHGIHVELSEDAVVAGNLAVGNGRHGIRVLDSADVRVWNNTLVGNERQVDVLEGPRQRAGPGPTYVVADVEVRNNLLQGRAGVTTLPLLAVEDITGRRPAAAMASADSNAYYRPVGTGAPLMRWGRAGGGPGAADEPTDLRGARALGAEARGSAPARVAPFLDRYAYRLRPGGLTDMPGDPLPADVARALGLPAGARVGVGVPTG